MEPSQIVFKSDLSLSKSHLLRRHWVLHRWCPARPDTKPRVVREVHPNRPLGLRFRRAICRPPFFSTFPMYVCPEPVLVNRSFRCKMAVKKKTLVSRTVLRADEERVKVRRSHLIDGARGLTRVGANILKVSCFFAPERWQMLVHRVEPSLQYFNRRSTPCTTYNLC
jgi:hypothetical protein